MSAIVASSDRTRSKASEPARSTALRARRRAWSDHALFGQRLDLLARHAEQLAVDVVVVLAVARRAAVDAAADVGGALAQLDRNLGERPAADLGAGHLGQPRERRELRVVVATVARRLAHAGRHAGALQGEHRLVRVARF